MAIVTRDVDPVPGGSSADPATNQPPDASQLAREPSWQQALRTAIRDPDHLCSELGLGEPWRTAARAAAARFSLFVPRDFLARIQPGDPEDPLLRQVLPLAEELQSTPGYRSDPVGDLAARRAPGLLHKYQGRVLLVVTGACAVHCRYCFRREFPYQQEPHSLDQWQPALERLAADDSIEEVILSGGDPLTLVDQRLRQLAEAIARVKHVRRLRIHTRLPIMIPQRVTPELLDWLRGTRLMPLVVVHANHPAELSGHVPAALGQIVQAGIPLLNQAVLLRGVNDNLEALEELSRRLLDLGGLPYYLHQLDRVRGASHFEVSVERGRHLIAQLRARLPGYAVPRYVQETEGLSSKEVLA